MRWLLETGQERLGNRGYYMFPVPPGIPVDHLGYLHRMDKIYVNDTYN